MKRNKPTKKVSAILTADWHLREDQPTCRTDDFEQAQWKKVAFVKQLQEKHNCPIYHSGDLFDFWKPSPALLSKAIKNLPNNFHTIYGNHDLPQHSLALAYKSGIYCLETAGALYTIPQQGDWGRDSSEFSFINFNGRKILILHTMTYQGKLPYPGCKDPRSAALLRKYKDADLIVTGHNHKPFVEEHDGRVLVNPGSLTRQNAAEVGKPRIYLWYAEDNSVEIVYLPAEEGVISREHIEVVAERDNRIDAFVSTLQEDFEASLDYEKNLEEFLESNEIKKPVQEIVYKSIGK